jgi:DNA-binding HxlR family transcriptional regulator
MATRTAAQRREKAKVAYDAFLAECPTRQLLDTLSGKWVSLVVSALSGGPFGTTSCRAASRERARRC